MPSEPRPSTPPPICAECVSLHTPARSWGCHWCLAPADYDTSTTYASKSGKSIAKPVILRKEKKREIENNAYTRTEHMLVIPYPSQGHINPLLHFSKQLSSKGVKTTLAITLFIYKSINPQSSASVHFDTISDGCDQGGFEEAGNAQDYIKRLETFRSKTMVELIVKHKQSSNPIGCIVYDASIPWALDVAKQFGLVVAPFFTQMCAVDYIYYNVHHGLLSLPISKTPVSIPGLPLLEHEDLPSFVCSSEGSYAAYLGRA